MMSSIDTYRKRPNEDIVIESLFDNRLRSSEAEILDSPAPTASGSKYDTSAGNEDISNITVGTPLRVANTNNVKVLISGGTIGGKYLVVVTASAEQSQTVEDTYFIEVVEVL